MSEGGEISNVPFGVLGSFLGEPEVAMSLPLRGAPAAAQFDSQEHIPKIQNTFSNLKIMEIVNLP